MKTRTRPFSPGRYEQHFADARSDPYALDAKLAEPAACSRCGASYHDGHWQWQAAADGAKAVLSPSCRRIEDRIPSGYLTIDDVPAGWSVSENILRQANKQRADLVVLGTHGRRGLRRVVMGSDAEAVLRECRVPVLVVRSAVRARASAGTVVAPARRSPKQKAERLQ
jgi:nucleotide-binding universal stress UspA family protein